MFGVFGLFSRLVLERISLKIVVSGMLVQIPRILNVVAASSEITKADGAAAQVMGKREYAHGPGTRQAAGD